MLELVDVDDFIVIVLVLVTVVVVVLLVETLVLLDVDVVAVAVVVLVEVVDAISSDQKFDRDTNWYCYQIWSYLFLWLLKSKQKK